MHGLSVPVLSMFSLACAEVVINVSGHKEKCQAGQNVAYIALQHHVIVISVTGTLVTQDRDAIIEWHNMKFEK